MAEGFAFSMSYGHPITDAFETKSSALNQLAISGGSDQILRAACSDHEPAGQPHTGLRWSATTLLTTRRV